MSSDDKEIISAILGQDFHHVGWKGLETHVPRNDGAHRQ